MRDDTASTPDHGDDQFRRLVVFACAVEPPAPVDRAIMAALTGARARFEIHDRPGVPERARPT